MEAITLIWSTNNLEEDLTPNQDSNSTQDVSTHTQDNQHQCTLLIQDHSPKITMAHLLPEETTTTKTAILNDLTRWDLKTETISQETNTTMINTGQTTTAITSIIIQEATTEVIKDNQHGEDPDPTPEDQWLEEITTDQLFIKLTPTSMMNPKID